MTQSNSGSLTAEACQHKPKIILFDLLTALIDSWEVWNDTAGSEAIGKKWRMTYLALTYGCGAYRPYETLVREAAIASGLEGALADRLDHNWKNLRPWEEVGSVLRTLKQDYQLGVVTNCSERLGHMAADLVGVPFDIVVTSDRAGFYKPDPRPYQLALDLAGVNAQEAIFVAGSAYDLIGTAAVGIPTFWHNRIGLTAPEHAPAPIKEMATLTALPDAIRDYIGA
ncbi:(S)-2-haloacid dehalogenase 4A [Leminorella richardii]|uniref:(S)-2-haloacid dehalogenase 4A n=1 Tax=Leminorella richardii TaxID=158841 RepID=A0A2X4UQ01_9GAMM|nr:HAD-IA family hydrolase [Leminorella richardii]SQI40943.1 (S)-2-haloacid dehalogenase 4A [Leminorella richardii]